MSTHLKVGVLLGLAMAAACGRSTPAPPTAPGPTSIRIAGSDLLLVGRSEIFSALDNAGEPLGALWGTDAPAVVTVEAYTGRITAVGTGTATIFADAGGARGTKTIRTLPDFGGSWSGSYEETACQASGDWADVPGICGWDYYYSAFSRMTMTLTQDRDSVSGGFQLDGRSGPQATDVSGQVSLEGTLTFTGTVRGEPGTIEVRDVRFELSRNDRMTGTFEIIYSTADRSGTLRVAATLRGMQRWRSVG
jgi:hypothetical protein